MLIFQIKQNLLTLNSNAVWFYYLVSLFWRSKCTSANLSVRMTASNLTFVASIQWSMMSCPLPNRNTELTHPVPNPLEHPYKPLRRPPSDTDGMEVSAFFIPLIMSLIECANVHGTSLTPRRGFEGGEAARVVRTAGLSLECELQGLAWEPAFSMDGDYIIGGVFSLHHYREQTMHEYTARPKPSRCTGWSVT